MFHSKHIMPNFLRPKSFIIGIFIGFIFCCIAGYIISQHAGFNRFIRFHNKIQPATHYYPTAHELLATAKHRATADQTLVIIGGSSIFRGAGQNADDLWSLELQKILGPTYRVINFAVDGGGITSFGSIAYRMLKEKYSKILFISTCTPWITSIEGAESYHYLFWDAYYKNLFHPDKYDQRLINKLRRKQLTTANGMELHVVSLLDSIFYFRNLWNWVGYRYIFTVFTNPQQKESMFQARRKSREEYHPDYPHIRQTIVNDKKRFQDEVKDYQSYIGEYVDLSKKDPEIFEDKLPLIAKFYAEIFSPSLRNNTLCVMTDENPIHLNVLSKKEKAAHELLFSVSEKIIRSQGYHFIRVGKNFSPIDYIDGKHFLASGGKKIALEVAKKIKEMKA